MPNIDVSDLLCDPDFATTFTVTRSVQTVGTNGRASYATETQADVVGVVSPSNTNELARMPEGSRVQGAITIRSVIRLSPGDREGRPADVIFWNEAIYTVRQTNDWSEFGQGFIEAVCERNPLA